MEDDLVLGHEHGAQIGQMAGPVLRELPSGRLSPGCCLGDLASIERRQVALDQEGPAGWWIVLGCRCHGSTVLTGPACSIGRFPPSVRLMTGGSDPGGRPPAALPRWQAPQLRTAGRADRRWPR